MWAYSKRKYLKMFFDHLLLSGLIYRLGKMIKSKWNILMKSMLSNKMFQFCPISICFELSMRLSTPQGGTRFPHLPLLKCFSLLPQQEAEKTSETAAGPYSAALQCLIIAAFPNLHYWCIKIWKTALIWEGTAQVLSFAPTSKGQCSNSHWLHWNQSYMRSERFWQVQPQGHKAMPMTRKLGNEIFMTFDFFPIHPCTAMDFVSEFLRIKKPG